MQAVPTTQPAEAACTPPPACAISTVATQTDTPRSGD